MQPKNSNDDDDDDNSHRENLYKKRHSIKDRRDNRYGLHHILDLNLICIFLYIYLAHVFSELACRVRFALLPFRTAATSCLAMKLFWKYGCWKAAFACL